MRKRFEPQIAIGQKLIKDIEIKRCRDAFPKLVLALKELYLNVELRSKVFRILEDKILAGKKKTGRKGMDLWVLFVMAQTRLCLNISYDRIHHMANYDTLFRQIMGIETESGFARLEFEYQNIIDNVALLDDITLSKINEVLVELGHNVFKKKEGEALFLKTDSFVVESNVHFPTDYNLLWDSARKCLDTINKICAKHQEIMGWRKEHHWRRALKNGCRAFGSATKSGGKNKEERLKSIAQCYINKARTLEQKLLLEMETFPLCDNNDFILHFQLNYFIEMLSKHIDLFERRIIKGEKIPHSEKVFSIFEPYTEMINKGKQHPNVELGKMTQITTDQYHLIVNFQVMEHEVDKSTVISLADKLLNRFHVAGWSFDKGFYTAENKAVLSLFIDELIMPKKGNLTQNEKIQENAPRYKKLRNQHSAVESNINELENRGLDRCPDKGYDNFKRYIALGVCSYNLHRIGSALMRQMQCARTTRAA